MEFGYWNENFTEWRMFVENGITNNWEADQFFNFDRIGIVGGNIWMSPPFPSTTVDETATTKDHDERRRVAGRDAEGRT